MRFGPLLGKAGVWLARRGAEEVLREIHKRQRRRVSEAGLRDRTVVPDDEPAAQKAPARADDV